MNNLKNNESLKSMILSIVELNNYKKDFYGYRKVTKEHNHWITIYEKSIQMYGYRTDDEDMEKVYDTGMVQVDNKQLQHLIDVWLFNYV